MDSNNQEAPPLAPPKAPRQNSRLPTSRPPPPTRHPPSRTRQTPQPAQNQPNQPNFRVIDGRKYVEGNRRYMFPNDEEEVSRLQLQHYCFRHLFEGNFKAPIENQLVKGIKVLDVGCGSGIWSLEMALAYPNSTFIGTDMAPVFPTDHLPVNCSFRIANTLPRLPYDDGTFDYVFQRLAGGSFTDVEWVQVIQEFKRILKPGGWIELIEGDYYIHNQSPNLAIWDDAVLTALQGRGINPKTVCNLANLLVPTFVEVRSDFSSFPIGFGGRLGALVSQNMELTFKAFKPLTCIAKGWSGSYYDTVTNKSIEEFAGYKPWCNAFWGYGIKALDVEVPSPSLVESEERAG